MTTFYIVLAGALGCVGRWSIEEVVERQLLSHRPYATMAINAIGSLIAGFVIFASIHGRNGNILFNLRLIRDQPYLLAGFCGGFTTFSSAIAIPFIDGHHGQRWRATSLIAVTPLLCIIGYWLGELIAGGITS